MGPIQVTVAIRNPVELNPSREGLFLVDASATECIVPGQHLEAIGFMAEGQRHTLELRQRNQDGHCIRMKVTYVC